MARLLLLLSLLPSLALAQDTSGTIRRWSEVQPLTRGEPLVSCLNAFAQEGGVDARQGRGFRVGIEAPAGNTVTGGALRAWYFDFGSNNWARNPALDLTPLTGYQRQWFPDQPSAVRTGCILYAADGITLSGGGSTVTVRISMYTGAA